MAVTLLHEMAHAAHIHTMGLRCEDFFEDALVAEAGFDYISQIFGMVPNMVPKQNASSTWVQWQSLYFQNSISEPINEICRNAGQLATDFLSHRFDVEYAEYLLTDRWWKEFKDRSVDLVPYFLLQRENARLLATAPGSFVLWVRRDSSGARDRTRQHQPRASSPTSSNLQFRQPTPSSSSSSPATQLEFDLPSYVADGTLHYFPFPFSVKAEDP